MIGVAALVALLIYVARVWPNLPGRVPTHFGPSGAPDAWGTRSTLLLLPGIATAMFLLMSFLERLPHLHNYPVEVTTENAPQLYSISRKLLLRIKVSLVFLFGFIFHSAVEVAHGNSSGLPVWLLPVLIAWIGGLVTFGFVQMRRAN